MKSEAYFLHKAGEPESAFDLRQFELPEAQSTQVIVEVEAFGLNYADVMAVKGLYRGAPPMPCVIGYESVGKVVEVGSKEDEHLIGKRVLAFSRFGSYARHVLTQNYAVVEVEDQPAYELLALCTQGVTAYYMSMYQSVVHKGDKVLIHAAAGGVGTLLIQLCKLRGAEVVAKVGHESKETIVKELGADHVVNYRSNVYEDDVRSTLGGKLDFSFNPAAGSTFKKDMALLGPGGKIVLFGASEFGAGKWGILSKLNFVRTMGKFRPIQLMMKTKSMLTVNMLEIADNRPEIMEECLRQVVALYLDGKLKVIEGGSYSSDQLVDAHKALAEGKTKGKLVVHWS